MKRRYRWLVGLLTLAVVLVGSWERQEIVQWGDGFEGRSPAISVPSTPTQSLNAILAQPVRAQDAPEPDTDPPSPESPLSEPVPGPPSEFLRESTAEPAESDSDLESDSGSESELIPGLEPIPDSVSEPEFVPDPSTPAIASLYQDPAGRFQLGILTDYRVSAIGSTPLFEAPDGRLAYTVVALPTTEITTDGTLIQAATELFQRGEQFEIVGTRPMATGVYLDWIGSLTIGGQTQPMQGTILAQQSAGPRAGSPQRASRIRDNTILILLVAATELGTDQLTDVTQIVAGSLDFS